MQCDAVKRFARADAIKFYQLKTLSDLSFTSFFHILSAHFRRFVYMFSFYKLFVFFVLRRAFSWCPLNINQNTTMRNCCDWKSIWFRIRFVLFLQKRQKKPNKIVQLITYQFSRWMMSKCFHSDVQLMLASFKKKRLESKYSRTTKSK